MRKSKKASGREKESYEKEQKLFTLYQNVEDMLGSFEEYVEEAKGETDLRLQKMQDMLEETRRIASELAPSQASAQDSAKEPEEKDEKPQEEKTESLHVVAPKPVRIIDEYKRFAAPMKISRTGGRVLELYTNGLSSGEIARQLGISVREVTLAMKMINNSEVK